MSSYGFYKSTFSLPAVRNPSPADHWLLTWRRAPRTAGTRGWRSWPASSAASPCPRWSSSRCCYRSAPPGTDSWARNLQYWRWWDYYYCCKYLINLAKQEKKLELLDIAIALYLVGGISVLPWGPIFCYVKSLYRPVNANATTAKPAAAEMNESQKKILRWKGPNWPMWSSTLS